MGEQLIKPYEISIWEDRLVTENDITYHKEIKLAVIGSDKMTHPSRVYNPILNEKINGEKTLTFTLAFRYFDPQQGEVVVNPFHSYLINERKIKLHYNDEWFEFLIKECEEDSESNEFTYTASELFSLELSKVGYNIVLDQSLNNNQGTAVELGRRALEGTDWQVDEGSSDALKQLVQEPLYEATVIGEFSALNLDTNEPVQFTVQSPNETIYVFYSYINNQTVENVQFMRASDNLVPDDDNVLMGTNYRFTEDVSYIITNNKVTGIKIDNVQVVFIGQIHYSNQGYRLVYKQKTTYDPVMNKTVDIYKASYGDGDQEIYHYSDYKYATSNLVSSYLTNGSNFNLYDNGTLKGWENTTITSLNSNNKRVLQPMSLTTYPVINGSSSLFPIGQNTQIIGYLKIKFNGVLDRQNNYANTYFNSGFNDSMAEIDHITAGEEFALRVKYAVNSSLNAPYSDGIRAIVAKYSTVSNYSCYLSENATTPVNQNVYKIDPKNIVLDFSGTASQSPNIIDNGKFNSAHDEYIIDGVVQTPSTLYYYKEEGSNTKYRWSISQGKYITESTYTGHYIYTAKAKRTYSAKTLSDPTFRLGVFLYVSNSDVANKWLYIQDIELTRCYRTSDGTPIISGNVPTAETVSTNYYYIKPISGMQANDINTYEDLRTLANEFGFNYNSIGPVYNDDCEKILSIQASNSNCFNILQSICETFECWLDINVEHEENGKTKLDKNYNPIKKVAFKEYIGKDNFSGFRNGINLSSINRTIDSNEIVTKLIVDSVQSEYADKGSVAIQYAKSNPSRESYILNFDYYLDRGLITNVNQCKKDLSDLNENLGNINDKILELQGEQARRTTSLNQAQAQVNVYDEMITQAKEDYNKAIKEFKNETGLDYNNYAGNQSLKEWAEANNIDLTQDNSVLEIIGKIYMACSVQKNYTGLLSNQKKQCQDIDLALNGAKEYGVAVSTTEVSGDNTYATQITIEDYIPGVSLRLINSSGGYAVFNSSYNDRIFESNSSVIYKTLVFVDIPANYTLQYYEKNKLITLTREQARGSSFSIYDSKNNAFFNRRFVLVPTATYAAKYKGLEKQIEEYIEQKKAYEKSFYEKYSRFIQEGTWSSQDYIDSELYYLDALQVSSTSAKPQVSYTFNVIEVSRLNNLQNYDFRIGDKTYVEDVDFFGYNYEEVIEVIDENTQVAHIIKTPIKEEVIISEIEWHLDEPDTNTVTIQNYKTQFEDLFQRISATVQTVQRNEITYPKTTSILDTNGTINSALLSKSMEGIGGYGGFALTSNGSVQTTTDGLLVKDQINSANVIKLSGTGIKVSTDGGTNWSTAITSEGISADKITAGTINTQNIWIMDGDNPSFRWDKSGLSAYGLDKDGMPIYDLKTYVRFDKYGLYGIKDGENFVAESLDEIKDAAHFGITWDGFFIKNSYTDGYVSITSDNDFQVVQNGQERIKIGAIEFNDEGAPTKYGINIKNSAGQEVFTTGSDGNITITGTINALAGNFSELITVGKNSDDTPYIAIDGRTGELYSSNYSDGAGTGWIIDKNGDAVFSNVSVRGAIKSSVFEYEEIQAVGGAFLFRPSTTIKDAKCPQSVITETIIDEETQEEYEITYQAYYHYEEIDGEEVLVYNDLILEVENPLLFQIDEWCKVSNYNSERLDPTSALSTGGLTHIYKIIAKEPFGRAESSIGTAVIGEATIIEGTAGIVLQGGGKLAEQIDLESLKGGSLISFGYEDGSNNYGIGINSSDNYVNLPRRAISLFESEIQPEGTSKVIYNYKGILGTLPRLSTNLVDDDIYNYKMAGTQGIFTNNMYIGDNNQYLAFYTDGTDKKLRIQASELLYTSPNGPVNVADIEGVNVTVLSTVGTQVDSDTVGALFVQTIVNGVEIDPIPIDIQAGNNLPDDSHSQIGDEFIHLISNENEKTAIRKVKIGSNEWEEVANECEYEWTFKGGSTPYPTQFTDKTRNKCIYIDNAIINGEITAMVSVTAP